MHCQETQSLHVVVTWFEKDTAVIQRELHITSKNLRFAIFSVLVQGNGKHHVIEVGNPCLFPDFVGFKYHFFYDLAWWEREERFTGIKRLVPIDIPEETKHYC